MQTSRGQNWRYHYFVRSIVVTTRTILRGYYFFLKFYCTIFLTVRVARDASSKRKSGGIQQLQTIRVEVDKAVQVVLGSTIQQLQDLSICAQWTLSLEETWSPIEPDCLPACCSLSANWTQICENREKGTIPYLRGKSHQESRWPVSPVVKDFLPNLAVCHSPEQMQTSFCVWCK